MNKVLLDTNFIVSCIKQKIDFFNYFKMNGFKVLIPKQVLWELNNIPNSEFYKNILKKNKFSEIDIGKGHVDNKIINYLKNRPEIFIATLDAELKKNLKNKKIIIRKRKVLNIE